MRIIRKKSNPITPQSPPQEMNLPTKNKNQKTAKEQASKTISQNTVSTHIKRAIEGITSKIEKSSIEKIILDAETDEGCDFLMKSFIDVFDNNSNSDTIILKSLEVIYILLHTSNSTFRIKMQYIMPEILTITTLNFKKSKVKFRNSVHELAKAIYLNLQRNTPFPSPTQLGLPESFPQFIPINSCRNGFTANITENKSSIEFDNDNISTNIDDNQGIAMNDAIKNLADSSPKQESSFNLNNNGMSLIDSNHAGPIKNNLDDDLIDCEDADDIPKENIDNQINNSIVNQDIFNNSKTEIDDIHQHPSKAKQALDDYLKNNGQEDGNNNVINPQKSDNLLLLPDDSFDTSSSVIYSSANLSNNEQIKNNFNTNSSNSRDIIENLLEPEVATAQKPRRQRKNFNISKEKLDSTNSPNIPRSQSLNVNMPMIIDSNINSNLTSGSQLIPNTQNELIDSNQIIDLTKPASTPTSPTTSLMTSTQNSFLDSILNSQPNTSPANNFNNPSTLNPPSPSTFNPPPDFNSPDSTSNYNSESTSNFILNSNQYSSQESKPNSVLNSNLELASQTSVNSVSDSILKIPSREMISPSKSSTIQILDSPSKFSSNIKLEPSLSDITFNKVTDSSTILQLSDNSIYSSPKQETKRPSSSRFNVKYEHLSPNNLLQKEENAEKNAHQPKAKKNFKIEKRISSPQSDNSEPINISQLDSPIDSLFNKYESDNNKNFKNTTSNDFSNQDLYNSTNQTNANDDFQASKPSFGLEDFDDQFEPITPVQSSSIQIFNDNKNNQIPESSILSTSEPNNTENEQFIPITPKRDSIIPQTSNGIDDRFIPITPVHTTDLDDSNDQKSMDSNQLNNSSSNNEASVQSDDQFVPITPVRNSLNFLDDDDLFPKSKSEGGSFTSDQFVPITPVKENQLFTGEDDQFVPITPVKNAIDPLFDADNDSSNGNIDNNNNIKISHKNSKNGSYDQFVPISPSGDKEILSFSDDPAQNQINNNNQDNNNLYNQFVSIPKNGTNNSNSDTNQNQNSNSDNSLYDQFVPISPVAESIIPIFNTTNSETNDDTSIHSIMRNRRNNDLNNNLIMGTSPRSRRHLSFDSGILSPSSASDKFEAITPPNARSMFYLNQNYNNNIINNDSKLEPVERTTPISKPSRPNSIVNATDDDKSDSKMTDSSLLDQFEPITPPSSIQNRSQIEDLINSTNNNTNNDAIFSQTSKIEAKFNENFDKKLNGNHHVSIEITKKRKNSEAQQDNLGNFELINTAKDANRNTNSDINFESLGTNNFSKSHEHFKNDTSIPSSNKSQNPIDFKAAVSKNNQAKRFNVYIERTPSSQIFTDNDINT